MNRIKRIATVMTLGAVGMTSWFVGDSLVKNVRFARAEKQVELTREQLANVADLSGVYKQVGKAVEPSVVFIEVTKKAKSKADLSEMRRQLPFDDETLRRFFPDNDGDGEPDLPNQDGGYDQQGQGSGVIIETNGSTGWIVTNNHVAGGADELKITLEDGREIKNAKVVGTDPKTDLALIQIEANRLIAAPWGNSDSLEKGEIVMAFGAPFGYVGSMTHGIVSALNRQAGILGQTGYENFIQVDCPINPGNSGGPLVNTRGEVVGINTAILSRNGGFQGVGFAIPANQAKFVVSQLKSTGKVTRGWLGVSIGNLSANPGIAESFGFSGSKGVLVNQVFEGPADGKLKEGDIVISIDGNSTANMNDLRNAIAKLAPGTETTLKVWRDGKEQEVKISVGEQPENPMIASRSGKNNGKANDGGGETGATAEKLGLRLTDPTPAVLNRIGVESLEGAVVLSVNRNSVAGKAGIAAGDVITKIGNTEVTNVDTALEALAQQDLSKGIRMHVTSRAGKRFVFVKDE